MYIEKKVSYVIKHVFLLPGWVVKDANTASVQRSGAARTLQQNKRTWESTEGSTQCSINFTSKL